MIDTSKKFIEFRSEEVQEMLSRPPFWILRWGIVVIGFILLLIFFGAWIIRYPDIVETSFRLNSSNNPKAVLMHIDGRITRLLVNEGQNVETGTVLAYLESTAQHDDVLRLSKEISNAWIDVNKGNFKDILNMHLSASHRLGELQTDYQTFEQNRINLRSYLNNGFYIKKRALLFKEIFDLQELSENLREQHKIQAQDIKISQEDYDIQKQLYEEKVIARLDLKREESKNINRQLPYQQTASSIITNSTSQRLKYKEILELDKQVSEERDKFLQAMNTLRSATDAWIMKYVAISPVSGHVSFPVAWQENQSIKLGQELLYIVPKGSDYIGEIKIPQQNAGKIKQGQDVLIKFAGFPFQEFGAVKGKVTYIADVPLRDSVFLAKVSLPNGLKTTYGKTLTVKTGMIASASIITENGRLINKLFYQLRKAIDAR